MYRALAELERQKWINREPEFVWLTQFVRYTGFIDAPGSPI